MTTTRGVPLAMSKQKHNGERCTSPCCVKKGRTAQRGSGYLLAASKWKRTAQPGGYLLTASKTGITTQRGGYLLVAPFFSSRRNVPSTCTGLLGSKLSWPPAIYSCNK